MLRKHVGILLALVLGLLLGHTGTSQALSIDALFTSVWDLRGPFLPGDMISCRSDVSAALDNCFGTFRYTVRGTSSPSIPARFQWSVDLSKAWVLEGGFQVNAVSGSQERGLLGVSLGRGDNFQSYLPHVCDPMSGACRTGDFQEFPANLQTSPFSGEIPFLLPTGSDTSIAAGVHFDQSVPRTHGEFCAFNASDPSCGEYRLELRAKLTVLPLPPPGVTVTGLSPVPEPTTLLLVGTTAAGLGLVRWRQRRRRQQP